MRKMFSASGTARKAARKSAAVRRKKSRSTEPAKSAAMQHEIDYAARSAFLSATTDVMKPAPIDTLYEILPVFSNWFARQLGIDDEPSIAPLLRLGAETNCTMSRLDTLVEAASP